MDLNSFVSWMLDIGIDEVALPFLLFFIILYVGLGKINIFQKEKNPRVLFALVMSFIPIIAHVMHLYPPCWDVVDVINHAFADIAYFILGILIFVMVVGFIGFSVSSIQKLLGWFSIAAFGFVVYAFITSTERGCVNLDIGLLDSNLFWLILLIVLAFFLIRWLIKKLGGGHDGHGSHGH